MIWAPVNWRSGARLLALSLAVATLSTPLTGCAVDDSDLGRWETTLGGPKRLLAVVRYDKYPHELRVKAAMSLIRMKPRRGERVGIGMLIEGTKVEAKTVPGLAGMDPNARAQILADLIPLIIEELKKAPPVAQAGQPLPPDESFKYKDAAFAMLTYEKTAIVADEALVDELEKTLTEWAMADFERRLHDRTQMFGMEQLLRFIGPASVKSLPTLMTKDTRSLAKIADLISKFADDETKQRASKKLVDIVAYSASDEWRADHTDELKKANDRAGFEPTPAQFKAQMVDYQNEAVIRVFASMKKVGGTAVVDYCLGVAENSKLPVKRRQVALAALEGRISRDAKDQIDRLLKIAKSDAPPKVLDQAFRRVKELPRATVSAPLYDIFKTDKWLVRRAAGGALLAMSQTEHIDEFLQKLDQNARKNFNLPEAITYGALLGALKEGNAREVLEKHMKTGRAPSRLSAIAYYYQHGDSKEDLAKVLALKGDDTQVPKCADDGGCDWTCIVVDGKKQTTQEIKTIGKFAEFCVAPKVAQNIAAKAEPDKKDGGGDEKGDEKDEKK